ncbi:MAG: class B sortase [Lachnospirales bacterium]
MDNKDREVTVEDRKDIIDEKELDGEIKENNHSIFAEDYTELEDLEMEANIISRNKQRKKNNKIINLCSIFMCVVSVAMVFLIYSLVMDYIQIYKNKKLNEDALALYNSIQQPVKETNMPAEENKRVNKEEKVEELLKGVLPDINILRESFGNDEIIGFLQIEDSRVNYPVVQHGDNIYYLDKDIKKDYNVAGSIFMDYENLEQGYDQNTVLYGHNMRDLSMFGELKYYKDQEYYEEHPLIKLQIEDELFLYEVFSAFRTSTDFDYVQTNFPSDEEYMDQINKYYEKSFIKTGVKVAKEDKILTLSTCVGVRATSRMVVAGRLINNVEY